MAICFLTKKASYLGEPGSGQNTLLAYGAIDLLRYAPEMSLLAAARGSHLPLWIHRSTLEPRIIARYRHRPNSLSDVVLGFGRRYSTTPTLASRHSFKGTSD